MSADVPDPAETGSGPRSGDLPCLTSAARVVELLDLARFRYLDEVGLHEAIALALAAGGVGFEREVRLSAADRIDFLVGRLGVEVKIAGRPADVLRQLRRYAASERVGELMLVTTRAAHLRLPDVVDGVRLHLVRISGAFR